MEKILIVDDHKLFLDGLRSILSSVDDFEIAGHAYTGEDALVAIKELRPTIVILDISMPKINGIEVTKIIKKDYQNIKVLILTMHLHRRMIIEALKAGADGYIMKDSKSDDFIEAIYTISNGQIYLSHPVSTVLVREYIQKIDVPIPDSQNIQCLSTREKEVLSLISEGMSTKMICDRLSISRNTVDTYRHNMMRKLGCDSLADLMRFAMREGAANLDE